MRWALLATALAAGCSGSGAPADAEPDADTRDGGVDASPQTDGGQDATSMDAASDASPTDGGRVDDDAATDAAIDARGFDASVDAGVDARAADSAVDTGSDGGPTPAPMVKIGREHSCGIDLSGHLQCWGAFSSGKTFEFDGVYTDIDVGDSHNCAVRDDGRLLCWGLNDDGQSDPTPSTCSCTPSCHCVSDGTYTRVATGADFTCAVSTAGSIECWGADDEGQSSPPAGVFTDIEAGSHHACAIRDDGNVRCWGYTDPAPVFSGRVASIAATGGGSCAVLADGSAECWGSAPSPPDYDFVYADAYNDQGCGIEAGGAISCWGADAPPLPAGLFRQIDHGYWFADEHGYCGITTSGDVECWGGSGSRLSPPSSFP